MSSVNKQPWTFRAIIKTYPNKKPVDILRDLVAGTPGNEGKRFAAAGEGAAGIHNRMQNRKGTDGGLAPRPCLLRVSLKTRDRSSGFPYFISMAFLHPVMGINRFFSRSALKNFTSFGGE